jgi:hypothetical protein
MVLENERNFNFVTWNHVLARDCFYDKPSKIYQRIPAHDTKITADDVNTKIRDLAAPAGRTTNQKYHGRCASSIVMQGVVGVQTVNRVTILFGLNVDRKYQNTE